MFIALASLSRWLDHHGRGVVIIGLQKLLNRTAHRLATGASSGGTHAAYMRAFTNDISPRDNKPVAYKETISTHTAIKLLAFGSCFGDKIKQVIADNQCHPRRDIMLERFKREAETCEAFKDHIDILEGNLPHIRKAVADAVALI